MLHKIKDNGALKNYDMSIVVANAQNEQSLQPLQLLLKSAAQMSKAGILCNAQTLSALLNTASIKKTISELILTSTADKEKTVKRQCQCEKPDVLFVAKDENDAAILRYAIRSYAKHAKNIGRIAIAGTIPKWSSTSLCYQMNGIDCQLKLAKCILTAAKELKLSKNFIYARPNVVLLNDIDLASVSCTYLNTPLPDSAFYSNMLSFGKSSCVKSIPDELHQHIAACEVLKANNCKCNNTSASPCVHCTAETIENALKLNDYRKNADAMCILGNVSTMTNMMCVDVAAAKTVHCANELQYSRKLKLPYCILDVQCISAYEDALRKLFEDKSQYETAHGQKVAVLVVCKDDDTSKLSLTLKSFQSFFATECSHEFFSVSNQPLTQPIVDTDNQIIVPINTNADGIELNRVSVALYAASKLPDIDYIAVVDSGTCCKSTIAASQLLKDNAQCCISEFEYGKVLKDTKFMDEHSSAYMHLTQDIHYAMADFMFMHKSVFFQLASAVASMHYADISNNIKNATSQTDDPYLTAYLTKHDIKVNYIKISDLFVKNSV